MEESKAGRSTKNENGDCIIEDTRTRKHKTRDQKMEIAGIEEIYSTAHMVFKPIRKKIRNTRMRNIIGPTTELNDANISRLKAAGTEKDSVIYT